MITHYPLSKNEIENVVLSVSQHVPSLKKERKSWSHLSEQKLWEEMVSCILGSRTNFEIAFFYSTILSNNKLIDIDLILNDPISAEKAIKKSLDTPRYVSQKTEKCVKYPFYLSRSEYIIRTALNIYKYNETSLKEVLSRCDNEFEAIEILFMN